MQISPVVVNGFKNGFHQWNQRFLLVVVEAIFFGFFFCFQNVYALYRPVAGKLFVLEDLCLDMDNSVTSALTSETVFEIIKCMSVMDVPARVRIRSKFANFQFFFQFWLRPR